MAANFLMTLFLVLAVSGADAEFLTERDLAVLEKPATAMMQDYLTALVDRQFADRAARLAALKTAADWQRHADHIRRSMSSWTGRFPPRTPLNARVAGRIERERYSLEKILFESRPGFAVSANLYLPKGYEGRRPAVLNVIGHSPAGKAAEKVQRRSIAQARKGLVAFTMLLSFESAVTVKVPAYRHEILLPGVLEKFDLPQVYQALCPARVLLLNPLRGDREPASREAAEKVFRPVADTYRAIGGSHRWRVFTGITKAEKPQILLTPERSPLYH